MPETERQRFQQAWVRIAPNFYIKDNTPRPDSDLWMVRLAWEIWQAAARSKDA